MFTRDRREPATGPAVASDDWLPEAADRFDPHAMLASADRACCCTARPAVVVLMPPSRARRHRTDLLLCRHHYRVSQQALAAAGAVILDPDSPPARADDLPGNPAIMTQGIR